MDTYLKDENAAMLYRANWHRGEGREKFESLTGVFKKIWNLIYYKLMP
jgi:hypothetical protein